MKRAVNCHDCIHNLPIRFCEDFHCGKGHKPRHYVPTSIRDEMENPLKYGWKRRCGDYKARPPCPEVIVEYGYGRGLPMATSTPAGYIVKGKP